MNPNNYCVILAGGIGSRLWPCSRENNPKQFIDILGTGVSLLQQTYKRFLKFIDKDNIIVVTNKKYINKVRQQLPNLSEENLLLEPMRRNTVPSVIWAAIKLRLRNENASIIVTPIDQQISNEEMFEKDILQGLDYVSKNDRLLTIGVVPTRPETTYGYIQMSDEIESNIFKVKSFTEKPVLEFAKLFVENKEFLWNTGLFLWNAKAFLKTIVDDIPEYSDFVKIFEEEVIKEGVTPEIIDNTFVSGPNDPIETGVLEKANNVDVMKCNFGWADIGTWESLFSVLPKDSDNNAVIGQKSKLYNCKDCIIKLPSGRIAILQDLENYVIAEEGNVLVVCKKDDRDGIRRILNEVEIELGDSLK
jgi:mannose-1-phosphate guanylyltransferase